MAMGVYAVGLPVAIFIGWALVEYTAAVIAVVAILMVCAVAGLFGR